MRIAVDFDGTIVEHTFPTIGEKMPHAFDTLKKLHVEGHQLILWTYRWGDYLNDAVEYCSQNGITFYAINQNHPGESFNSEDMSRKIDADIYIDDRNIGGFYGWERTYRKITSMHSSTNNDSVTRQVVNCLALLGKIILVSSLLIFLLKDFPLQVFLNNEITNNSANNDGANSIAKTVTENDEENKHELSKLTTLITEIEKEAYLVNSERTDESIEFQKNQSAKELPISKLPTKINGKYQAVNSSDVFGKYPEGSTRLLTEGDLVGKSRAELKILQNEILARHSYIFKSPQWKEYFEQQKWYSPLHEDVKGKLTSIELRNFQTLL